MDSEREKYNKVVEILKRSKPILKDQEAFSEKIIHEVKRTKQSPDLFDLISDYLFGWVYIGWVRRSLVAVSFVILIVFIYQQSVILNRINAIDRQAIFTSSQLVPGLNDRIDTKLQVKYRDILKLIEDDPDLRKYIEKNLNQNDRKKFKL
jgi:hypothetical protein